MNYRLLILFAGAALLSAALVSCEKEITVDLPTTPAKIVVEGSIEQDQPPIVLLSWSQGYFDPTDLTSLEDYFISDAIVTVSDGVQTFPLTSICSGDLTEEQLEMAAEFLGIDPEVLASFNLCIYTSLDPASFGEPGKMYTLEVHREDHHLKAITKINELVYLDSLWFLIPNEDPGDSLGFIFGTITDPDTNGNAYRWFARRINRYPDWAPDDLAGEQKDAGFIAPIGSVFDDEFFNGLSFEFGYYRGSSPNSMKFDDLNEEAGFFKRGDTVVVRGCVIDRGAFRFFSSFEDQVASQGSPFAVPFNVESNVAGGLGIWVGYGAVYDTVICQ